MLLHALVFWSLLSAFLMPAPPPQVTVLKAHIQRTQDKPPPPPPVSLAEPAVPLAHMPVVPLFVSPPLPDAITQPPAPPAPVAAPPGPPEPPAPPGPPPDFLSRLFARINAFKRYPRAALSSRLQGRPVVHFVMDREGRVLSCVVEQSSGIPILDQAAVAAVTDAQPLPALPPQLPGPTYAVTLGINFSLNR